MRNQQRTSCESIRFGSASGSVSLNEFIRVVQRLVPTARRSQIVTLFREFDRDHGGTIQYEELHRALRTADKRAKASICK